MQIEVIDSNGNLQLYDLYYYLMELFNIKIDRAVDFDWTKECVLNFELTDVNTPISGNGLATEDACIEFRGKLKDHQ